MSVVAIIQARCGSTRLPNKVFREFAGKSSLAHQVARVRACRTIDDIVIATTTESRDGKIAEFSSENGLKCFRGSEIDVLDRFYQTCLHFKFEDVLVRLTADCPLLDPEITDRTVCLFLENQVDYVSNSVVRTFPIGTDTEVFTFSGLKRCQWETPNPAWREHVTPYFYKSQGVFRTLCLKNDQEPVYRFKGSAELGSLRLTLDTTEDLALISKIYEALYKKERPLFGLREILQELERDPGLIKLNEKVQHRVV